MNVRTPFLRSLIAHMQQSGEIPPSGKAARIQSRREFLRTLTFTGSGALVGCAGFSEPPTSRATTGTVAIVGGGIAGLTAAYRLSQRGVKVDLYEAQSRLGGRMWTKKNFNSDAMFCELGGELVDTNHAELIALAKELGLKIQSLKSAHQVGSDYYYVGGKIRTDADLIPAFAPLARRLAADIGKLYDKDEEFTAHARALDRVPLNAYLQEACRSTGTADWVRATLDLAYVTEYGVETQRQSALNMIDMISPDTREGFKVYGDSDEAYRIQGGSGALPDALVRRLTKKIDMHLSHRLEKIADDGRLITLDFKHDGKHQRIAYDKVILALPFTVLRQLSGIRSLALSAGKHQAIHEMGWGANAKVMLGFKERFWKKLRPANLGGAFSDALFQTWDTSNGQPGSSGILTCYIGGTAARSFSSGSAAGYLDKVSAIFPAAREAYDGNRTAFDWTHFDYAKGSFSATAVGQYCDMVPAAATPELKGRLLFAGEHTSPDFPGYMNGGVESGERVAAEV